VPSWHGAISRAYCGTTSLRPLAVQLTAPAASDTSPHASSLYACTVSIIHRGCHGEGPKIARRVPWRSLVSRMLDLGSHTGRGPFSGHFPALSLRTSALSPLRSRPASERGKRASPRDRWAGAGADEVHMARLCSYSSPERWEGFPAWRRQTRVPQRQPDVASRFARSPSHLPLPPAALCHRWTGAAERLLALHLHQRARLKAHHNLDVLTRAIHPCSAAPLAASLASSSAVISIGQGCNKFEGQPSARRAHCTQGRLC
jgi:hypothetical protein